MMMNPERLAIKIRNARKTLIARMNALAQSLTESAKRIESGERPNQLGEIQGRGNEIDALCGVLAAFMNADDDRGY